MAKRKVKHSVKARKAKEMLDQRTLYIMFGTIFLILLILLVKFR